MIGFLYRWIIGSFYICDCSYKIIKSVVIVDEDDVAIGHKYVLKCEKCGNIKSKKV